MLASVRVLLCVRGVCQAAAERGSGRAGGGAAASESVGRLSDDAVNPVDSLPTEFICNRPFAARKSLTAFLLSWRHSLVRWGHAPSA